MDTHIAAGAHVRMYVIRRKVRLALLLTLASIHAATVAGRRQPGRPHEARRERATVECGHYQRPNPVIESVLLSVA